MDGKFLLEMGGGRQEWGGWFYNGGGGKFLKSLKIVDRGMLTPLFYEDPPMYPISPFSNVAHPPQLPCHLQPPPPLFFLLSCLLNDDIDLNMSSLGSLVPEGS